MADYENPNVACPFYKSEDNRKIKCEGISSITTLHLVFNPCSEKKGFRQNTCEGDYHKCPIARLHFRRNRGEE